ncbi:TetR/AcrR family transcriptional regulator C-terminal domain-containing protein [Streptomyces kunmingensis]|uniref:TetR/AcrR family transcriptional regulator C-terminal domain-containing protein n=1 Tax=Streptomyces kunmingensis TaxID=68225 RepID=A0ABU6CBK0_9ACTN|nr:TetR/AcrR family transcriptional regulator C-terminal domain-containing protein [Streptomyces kunmingensis]MEB3962073.1 TetR/AcrR family transcriptional regulator C-terminal domain-containing protein [Streptomyces kunmingensis]
MNSADPTAAPTPAPRSRRERPAKPALSRDGIVAAAVHILRTEGLGKVTMRRLARELDTGPASLYVYVRNTDELHAAVLDALLAEVDLAPARDTSAPWQDRLTALLTSYLDMLFRHPSLARSALTVRPEGEHYLDLVEAVLSLLIAGGVPDARAAWGVDLLLMYATATAAEHAGGEADHMDATAAALATASPARHPELARLSSTLVAGAPQARLSWGFAALIAGIAAAPEPPTATS